MDRDHVEAKEEVLSKEAFFYEGQKILVRRGKNPNVDPSSASGSHHVNLFVLKDPQELDLHGGTGFTDLVEKNTSSVCGLKEPRPRFRGSSKGPFKVAKELALQKLLRDGATINRHERRRSPFTVVGDSPRTSSFPVPLSPEMRTVVEVEEALAISRKTLCMAFDSPMRP
jgi:hypothetical protein